MTQRLQLAAGFAWILFLQAGLGVVWVPLFTATVVHDLGCEWMERRERAKRKEARSEHR